MTDTTTTDADRLRWLQSARVREDLYRIAAALRVPQYASLAGEALRDAIVTRVGWQSAVDAHRAAPAPVTGGLGAIIESAVADAVRAVIAATPAPVDSDTVRRMVDDAVQPLADRLAELARAAQPTRIVVERQDAPPVDVGVQHAAFPRLLRACGMVLPSGHRMIPYLVGPPGTGKSSACYAVSASLGLPYGETGAVLDAGDLFGYRDVTGTLVRTVFRDVWEHGGVFLFDEFDGSDPQQAVRVNNALASGRCAFPDGVVSRHQDCVIVFAANTDGKGGSGYQRLAQDKATMDRLYTIRWPIDEALESALCPDARWLRAVRAMRAECESRGQRDHVTPRASIMGAVALANGEGFREVAEAVVRKGLVQATWDSVLAEGRRAWGAE